MASKPELGYWKIRGLAQPIRLLLNHVGQEFTDTQYVQGDAPEFSRAEWLDKKPSMPLAFPNLPYYIDGDVKITQSNAILRHIGRQHNLLGSTPALAAEVDMVLDQVMDFRNGFVRLCYGSGFADNRNAYVDNAKKSLASFSKYLADREFLVGELSVADFHFYEMLDEHKVLEASILDDYANLQKYCERFEALPNIAAYMKSDQFMKAPLNNKIAGFGSK